MSSRAPLHAVCALAGIALLALTVVHDAPWQMRFVHGDPEPGSVRIAVFGASFVVPLGVWLGGFGALVALAIAVTWRRAAEKRSLGPFSPRRLALLGVVALGFVATLAPSPYGWWITLYLSLAGTGFTLAAIGLSPLVDRALAGPSAERFWRAAGRRFDAIPGFAVAGFAAAAVFAAAVFASGACFAHLPHVEDSGAQYFHGKIFALGRLTAPSSGLPEFFAFPHMIDDGRWYSMYPPGHSLLLGLGHLGGAPWLVNPIFGAFAVLLLYPIGRELFDERTGKLAALLGAVSPFVVFMSSEFMNHATTLACFELCLLGYARFVRGRGGGLLGGLGAGYALLIRPLTVIAAAAPFAIDALVRLVRAPAAERARGRRAFAVAAVSVAAFAALLLAYNAATNGAPLVFGYEKLYGSGHGLGFGRSGWGEPHTPAEGARQTLRNLNALEKYLFELPFPSLVFAFIALASSRAGRSEWLLAASAASLAFAYFFYWFEDWCFGPRFLFEASAPLILLSARGLVALPDGLSRIFGIGLERARAHILVAAIAAFAIGWASNVPPLVRLYSADYYEASSAVALEVRRLGLRDAIVFVRGSYKSEFPENDPLLGGDVIYVRDLGVPRNLELLARFPGRTPYLAVGGRVHRVAVRPREAPASGREAVAE